MKPRYYILPTFNRPGWQVISDYAEEEIVEATFDAESDALAAVSRVQAFRADQTEAPDIRVEHVLDAR